MGSKKIWRQLGEEVLNEVPRNVKSINVYCYFSNQGFGKLVVTEGGTNKESYSETIKIASTISIGMVWKV